MSKQQNTAEKSGGERAQWGSKIGFILAAAGSAVGLGNIWKFPGKAYEGGGGIFLLAYIALVIIVCLPVMLCEFSIGRASQANSIDAYAKLGHPKATWIGWVGVLVAFIITSYYSHVGGWVMRYAFTYATGTDDVYADPLGYFYKLLGYNAAEGTTFFPWVAILFAFIFMAITCFIVVKGVSGGIEKFNKVGMPALFVLLIVLLVRSLTMEGSGEGLKYMLSFDFSKLKPETFLIALAQAFYSLSLGMAIMITYASYLPKSENIMKNAGIICSMDTVVAFIAGFIVIPAVFATLGASGVGKGGGFAFAGLAGVFQAMPGGRFFGLLFYVLLLFAALTSCISLVEGIIAFLTERFNWKRTPTAIITCAVMFAIGVLYTISQASVNLKGVWLDFKGFQTPALGDAMEYLTDRLMIPVCALGICIFVGWIWKPKNAIAELDIGAEKGFPFPKIFSFLVRFIAPAAIATILIASFVTGTTFS